MGPGLIAQTVSVHMSFHYALLMTKFRSSGRWFAGTSHLDALLAYMLLLSVAVTWPLATQLFTQAAGELYAVWHGSE